MRVPSDLQTGARLKTVRVSGAPLSQRRSSVAFQMSAVPLTIAFAAGAGFTCRRH
jgi:hypothetical protein